MSLDSNTQPLTSTLRLSELLSAMSLALDLTEGQPEGHCVRCCWIGMHIGRELGLSEKEISDLYYTLLLKDLGCSSNAARICELYLTDDISFKADFKLWNGSLSQALGFVVSHTGLEKGMAERFGAIIEVLKNGGEIAKELIETRCHRGADIARMMNFSEGVALGIQNLDEHWNGGGLPLKKAGKAIPLNSRIALLSQVIDVFHTAHGRAAALEEIRHRSGGWFQPDLVQAFTRVARQPGFWEGLGAPDLPQEIYALEPGLSARFVDMDDLDNIAAAFAKVIDAKSPFTSGHSERVTVFTDLIAKGLGIDEEKRRWLRRAALLHDIGKLGISNSILDKPGKLSDGEYHQIKRHPVYSKDILSKINVFSDLSNVAAGHHERLDGLGYPYGLAGDEIDLDTRIVTIADIFDALTADRPYRKAIPIPKTLAIMEDMVGRAIDENCFAVLKETMENHELANVA